MATRKRKGHGRAKYKTGRRKGRFKPSKRRKK